MIPERLARLSDKRVKSFRLRQAILGSGASLMVLLFAVMGLSLGGPPGMAVGASTALVFSAAFVFLLYRQAAWAGRRGVHGGRRDHRPSEEEDINAPEASTQATSPPVPSSAAAPARPVESHRSAGHFARPGDRPGQANLHPWRLPSHPGPSGISADSALVGDLSVRAASIVGPGHRCEEPATPRQDAYRLGIDEAGRYLIVAVADGMSDSSHSDLGANVATDTIAKRLRVVLAEHPPHEKDIRECFGSAAERMTATAQQRGLTRDDVRAAVLAAIVELNPDADGRRTVFLATVADVSAWLRRERSWEQIAGAGKHGLDAGRLSEFLPHFPSAVKLRSRRLAPGDVLALTTDGIGDVLASGDLATWFADEWERPPFIGDFIGTVGFETRGELDDRTAIVVWCPGRRP